MALSLSDNTNNVSSFASYMMWMMSDTMTCSVTGLHLTMKAVANIVNCLGKPLHSNLQMSKPWGGFHKELGLVLAPVKTST